MLTHPLSVASTHLHFSELTAQSERRWFECGVLYGVMGNVFLSPDRLDNLTMV